MVTARKTAISVNDISKIFLMAEKPALRFLSQIFLNLSTCLPKTKPFFTRLINYFEHSVKKFSALKGVTFDIGQGESIGIIGRNGSGKSTLLQIIAGTLQPSSGSIKVNGKVAALLELGSGFNPDFTGRENVYLSASVLGLKTSQIDQRFNDIASFADIGDFIDQPLKTYSSGMCMRLAFSVIVHVDADIMIIDEALAVGDAFFIQKCMRWIREFSSRGTLLFVTHNAADITNLCSKAIWIDQGEIRLIGDAKQVTENYLADIHSELTGIDMVAKIKQENKILMDVRNTSKNIQRYDQRLAWINLTKYRNDIKIVEFNPEGPSFGAGGANLISVDIYDEKTARPLNWIVGGEIVILKIIFKANQDLNSPILGFYLKDKLGQYLFGDNTYIANLDMDLNVTKGSIIESDFKFQMPRLSRGHYSICAAIATGSQDNHVQQYWAHDALIFESLNENPNRGILGIHMLSIKTKLDHIEI